MKDAIIFFNVNDRGLIWNNQCLAEAFISFQVIPEYSQNQRYDQTYLTLTRLKSDGMPAFQSSIRKKSQALLTYRFGITPNTSDQKPGRR
jgi:hypothetical protein